tara:strand:- start:911 stop:2572 length:1662 start_codon:yes stop_codon:yes gene_type:complete
MTKISEDLDILKEQLEAKQKIIKAEKTKYETSFYKELWEDEGLQNPLEIVKDFIKEKGLKLYGGLALNEHLKKYKKGFYESYEFPDYDVFSPDAWNHAKELADRLHKLGYQYVEAKGSVLNDDIHQTYKVGVDMIYILDLTQAGCTRSQLINSNCDKCGITKDNTCFSLFNNIPAVNLLGYNPKKSIKTHRITYDYSKDESLHKSKLFLCSPDWLKISMYREMTEPLSNPDRLVKVGTRLHLFNSYFKENEFKCDRSRVVKKLNPLFEPLLSFIQAFTKKNKLIHYGTFAYNFYVKGSKFKPEPLNHLNVYSSNVDLYSTNLLNELTKKYPSFSFNTNHNKYYWKEVDVYNVSISVSKGDIQYRDIITFTNYNSCMPYVQYNGIKYATITRMKYVLYRAVVLRDIIDRIEFNPDNYECMLDSIVKLEAKLNLKYSTKSKFRKNVYKCDGDELNKIVTNLINMTSEKEELLKQTQFLLDYPEEGLMSKIYPTPKGDIKLPYRPGEKRYKKYKRQIKTKKGKKLVTIDSLNSMNNRTYKKGKTHKTHKTNKVLFQ